jgi:hypothetical protein
MSDFQLHTPETDAGLRRPFVEVAVVMRRERIDNRWQPWRWSLSEIIPHEAGFGSAPRLLLRELARPPQRHHALTLVPLSTHLPWLLRLQQPLLLPVRRLPRHQLLRLLHLRLPRSPDSCTAFFKSRLRKGSAFLM